MLRLIGPPVMPTLKEQVRHALAREARLRGWARPRLRGQRPADYPTPESRDLAHLKGRGGRSRQLRRGIRPDRRAGRGPPGEVPALPAEQEIRRAARELADRRGLKLGAAIRCVVSEQPELWEQYRAEHHARAAAYEKRYPAEDWPWRDRRSELEQDVEACVKWIQHLRRLKDHSPEGWRRHLRDTSKVNVEESVRVLRALDEPLRAATKWLGPRRYRKSKISGLEVLAKLRNLTVKALEQQWRRRYVRSPRIVIDLTELEKVTALASAPAARRKRSPTSSKA